METAKQVSVFLENKPGRLANVLRAFEQQKINVTGLTVMDSHEHSVLRLVINDVPRRATSITGLDWPGRQEGLSDRESEILALITQGKSNTEVARLTFLSPNTVKTYIRSVYRKIGVASRTQAVLWGVAHGFTPDHHRIDHWRGGP